MVARMPQKNEWMGAHQCHATRSGVPDEGVALAGNLTIDITPVSDTKGVVVTNTMTPFEQAPV